MKKLLIGAAALAASLAAMPAQAQDFEVGDWVVGRYKGGNYWYPATVVGFKGNSILIEYDGGQRDTLRPNQVLAFRWGRGGEVQCKYSDGEFYDAVILSINGTQMHIRYTDDDEEQRINIRYCRSAVVE